MKRRHGRYLWWLAVAAAGTLSSGIAAAQSSRAMDPDKARVIEHWTSERRAQAIPRDLVIDPRGLGYLKRPDGALDGIDVRRLHDTEPAALPAPGTRAAAG